MMRRWDLFTWYGFGFIAFLYAPVLLLPLFSFNDNIFAIFPLKGFTLKAYYQLADDTKLLAAVQNSVMVGISVAVISTALGLLAAMAITRYRLPGKGPIVGTIMMPLVIPSIILGVALLVMLRQVFDIELSLICVAAGHVLLCVPFSMLVLISRLEGFDKNLEEAAMDLGENGWMTFWRVTFPIALPGIISSLLMSFTTSFDEYVLAFFLSGIDQTLPIYLWSMLRFPQRLPVTLALGSSILIISTIIVITSEVLRRRGVQSSKPTGL